MSNDASKLKARLLAGAKRGEPLYVPEFETDGCGGHDAAGDVDTDCDGVIQIRPLTDAEQAEVDACKTRGLTIRGTPGEKVRQQEFDAAVTVEGERRARRMAAAYGMSVDGAKWTPGDVGKLQPAAVKRIAAAVEALSGGGEEQAEQAAQFRPDAAGTGDGDPAPDGDADRADAS